MDGEAPGPGGRSPPLRPVAPPALELPKGGGALRSIGEKYTAGGPTGTGGLRIPIAASPGRAGFGPDVSLQYDSGQGQGPFGIGWHVSVPNVTRRTDQALPRYRDAEESDVFVLTGSEDLVPVEAAGGGRETFEEGGAVVVRYRPRVEALFARIERRTDKVSGESHWRVVTHDNVTSVYGLTAQARIADPDDPRRVFSWLLEAVHDDRGQVTRYLYKPEDLAGVDPADVAEATRLARPPVNRYLKRVRYGNTAPLPTRTPAAPDLDALSFLFELVLDYGEHPHDGPDEGPPWALRPDPVSSFRSGFEIRTYRLCRRALMFHRMPAELGAAATLVRATELQYEPSPVVTYLTRVRQVGYRPDPGGGPGSAATPWLELDYTRAPPLSTEVRVAPPDALGGLPPGTGGRRFQLVDLDGEGVPGVLAATEGAGQGLFYKRGRGGGRFHPVERLPSVPSGTSLESAQLLSLDADGMLDVVEYGGPNPGYFERTREGSWAGFAPFGALPHLDFSDPNLRFVDLDGDGLPDLLVSEEAVFVWYPSRGRDGFGPPERIAKPQDERAGPAVMFADAESGIFLADMTGDGLQDVVRIRNGEAVFWPNLGLGRFGPKVVMRAAPVLDAADRFDARRVRLGDIDGSGTSDLVYLHERGATVHFNQAGNGWSEGNPVPAPVPHRLAHVQLTDLLGTGTACLVWSSEAPGDATSALRYVDLLRSTKPHLLANVKNGLGGETRITYAPSTRFYLEDREAGRPWATRLPFPVHVVAQTEELDHVLRTRTVSRFRYAHGFYDGVEREFRGFARVEEWDAEEIPARDAGIEHLPPVRTVTWFHTGAWTREGEAIEEALRSEFWREDPLAPPLPPTRLPAALDAAEQREAWRALKGLPVRREVFGEDGTAAAGRPYLVSEHGYDVRRIQGRGAGPNGVFHAFERESTSAHYERAAADPRVEHELTLEVDPLGHVTRSAHLGYARRGAGEPEQKVLLAHTTRSVVAPPIATPAEYRHGVVTETVHLELPLPPGAARVAWGAVREAALGAVEVGLDAPVTVGQARVAERLRHRFWRDDLAGPLPLGAVEPRALVYDHYALALPASLLASTFGARVSPADVTATAGYVDLDGDGTAWAHAGVVTYDPAQFYQPTAFTDVFGNTATVAYDALRLFVVEEHTSTDPAFDNVTRAEIDYRRLAPFRLVDPNGCRNAVRYDALGMPVATAVEGRAGQNEGDTLDDPTTRIEYDLLRWEREAKPTFVHTLAREEHGAANRRWLETYGYASGSGLEVLKKAMAEPDGGPRWVGTGRTVFDNKGNPLRKYEPYFSTSPDYDDEPALVMQGYTAVFAYDPLSRLVRTDYPDGTFATVTFDAWSETRADATDTVLEGDWYAERMARPAGDPDRRAAELTALHAGTPAIHHVDPLGRTFLSVADAGPAGTLSTRLALDILGDHRTVTDARGNVVLEQVFDGSGQVLRATSVDAGTTLNLFDAIGRPVRSWDSRGFAHRKRYDRLRRLTHVDVTPPLGAPFLAERLVYGEGVAAPFFRGRLFLHLDGAGAFVYDAYDVEGRVTATTRRLAKDHRAQPDWSSLDGPAAPSAFLPAAAALLDPEPFVTRTTFDAMGRVKSVTTPDQTVAELTYNEAALLETVTARPRGGAPLPVVVDLDYNARGQRTRVELARGLVTTYTYDDRSTMLVRIRTAAPGGEPLQDLRFVLDPAHNVVQVDDAAQQTLYFSGGSTDGTQRFEYDPLHRLTRAEGREHPGQVGWVAGPRGYPEAPISALPHPNDLQALVRYVESYAYDAGGNLRTVSHAVPLQPALGFTRVLEYAPGSNRLLRVRQPGDPAGGPFTATFDHDVRGNMTRMPHLPRLDWDHDDRLELAELPGGGRAYQTYDGKGERVRRVVERAGQLLERVYVGNWERYRERPAAGGAPTLARETVHLYDGERRLALVETDTTVPAAPGAPEIRVQLANHLGTAGVETDPDGVVLTYEEFFPFGGTAFRAGDGRKRYRYTAKEKDLETGLYYHGARYYAPWLGRWVSPDPAGLVDGTDVYAYVENNPIKFSDPTGLWERPSWRTVAIVAAVVVVGVVVTVATAGAAAPLVGAAVASVGLTGTAATVATGVVVGAVAGAAGGIASEVTKTGLTEGRLPTGREVARAAAVGAAFGAVTGGVGAFASTARGLQAAKSAASAVSRVPGAATVVRGAQAVAKGAQAVARAPGVSQAVRATAATARATGRALASLERAAGSAGVRAARAAFSGEKATQFLTGYQASRSVASAFGAAHPSAPPPAASAAASASDDAPAAAGAGANQPGATPTQGSTAGGTPGTPAAPPPPPPAAAGTATAAPLTNGQIGRQGEQAAANFLQAQGYTNIRGIQNASGHGVDLVAELNGQTFFFEVKTSLGATAPALSQAQGNITTFVTSRLGRAATGAPQWGNIAPTMRQDAASLLQQIQSGTPIQGQVIEVTNLGAANQTITARTW
jgi:RHS repeat-associated protein